MSNKLEYENLTAIGLIAVNLLKKHNYTISFAESCTGGLAAKTITDFPGASEIISESYITYSDKAKEKILGVSRDTLLKYTAVSKFTAIEMATGVKKISGADVGVGITGYASPTDTNDCVVYIGISIGGDTTVVKLDKLEGRDRDSIRHYACSQMFELLAKKLEREDI